MKVHLLIKVQNDNLLYDIIYILISKCKSKSSKLIYSKKMDSFIIHILFPQYDVNQSILKLKPKINIK